MSIKNILLVSVLMFATVIITGCSTHGNPEVVNMNSSDVFTIGKTTIVNAEEELGRTYLIFDKPNGAKKYVYKARQGGIWFNIGQKYRTLILYFDKKGILIQQELYTSKYNDPDVQDMVQGIMKNFRR